MARSERFNLAERSGDKWRPPALEPGQSALGRALARVRRFFDFQAGSCWDDVAAEAKNWSGKVVDVGCGAQPYRSLLPAGMDYVGLDIANAEEAFGYAPPNVIHFDGGRWPAATHDADVVLCTEVLEHVLDPAAALSEAFSALKPGGQLMLTVPFAARWHFVPHDYWRYTPSSLKHLLEAAGFRKVVVHARGGGADRGLLQGSGLISAVSDAPASQRGQGPGAAFAGQPEHSVLRRLGRGRQPVFAGQGWGRLPGLHRHRRTSPRLTGPAYCLGLVMITAPSITLPLFLYSSYSSTMPPG